MSERFPEGVEVLVDDQGIMAKLTLDSGLYSEDVALRAAYWLTDRGHICLTKNSKGHLIAEIRGKEPLERDALTELCGEFCNSLIDFALRERVAAKTQDIQEAMLQRAFTELVPKSDG